jgi:glutamyl-tRNA reductase
MSEVLAIGASHKTAAVELRERLALSNWQAEGFIAELAADEAIDEVAAISTCNRTEFYVVTRDPVAAEAGALGRIAKRAGIRPTELAPVIYSLRNCDAARHLFRVSAGLESMVVGEAEVLGQVRRSYDLALDAGTTGVQLNRLFHSALRTGKRVRTETGIGERSLSVSTVAASLARELIGDLAGRRVVILGAGETAELAARALSDLGADSVFLANRRRDRALALAQRFDGSAIPLDRLPEQLLRADVVIGATSSPTPIVTSEGLAEVVAERRGRPLVLIDLAVPRDIEAACSKLEGVSVHDIDDLQAVINRNRSVRAAEAGRAEDIVEEEIRSYAKWLATLDSVPTIADLQARGREIADTVVIGNSGQWESASQADLERVALIARTVAQRLLHQPTKALRELDGEGTHGRLETVREIFGLDSEPATSLEAASDSAADVLPLTRRGSGDRRA